LEFASIGGEHNESFFEFVIVVDLIKEPDEAITYFTSYTLSKRSFITFLRL